MVPGNGLLKTERTFAQHPAGCCAGKGDDKIGLLKKGKRAAAPALRVQTRPKQSFSLPAGMGERGLYRTLRDSVPIIDAAIGKIRRLIGDFQVSCPDGRAQEGLERFLREVKVNAVGVGIDEFLGVYFEELLLYGNAVGEMVLSGGELAALYNASLDDVELEEGGALEPRVFRLRNGQKLPCPYPRLLLVSALNPPAGSVKGTSILRGLPFVSEILLKIYKTIGLNWDRAGNVRFAVTCKPEPGGTYTQERANHIAEEWNRTMRSGETGDFITVGDISVRAIGADNQLLESEVPVRQMLEQIVAKLGIPPFLLGLSWSSTERMSSQQADILTSELDAYRRTLTPVVQKICSQWLALAGFDRTCKVEWSQITMQDELDHANARYLHAQARKLELETDGKEGDRE